MKKQQIDCNILRDQNNMRGTKSMRNINEIKNKIYKICYCPGEVKKVDKIFDIYQTGKMNKENYYDHIRKLTKNVVSDRSLIEWERISEIAEFELFGGRGCGGIR